MHRTGPSARRTWLITFLTMAILGGLLALAGSPAGFAVAAETTTTVKPTTSSGETTTTGKPTTTSGPTTTVKPTTTTSGPTTTSGSTTTTAGPTTTTSAPTTTVPPAQEGCTPGFWKQPQHLDAWMVYTPGQTLESVFDVPDAFGLDSVTLLAALSLEGGSTTADAAEVLLRQAVAALLNAASPEVDYPLTETEIIAAVNAALASGDRGTILALAEQLDTFNNLFCPLD
jgi:hypothetical protein